MGYTKKKLKKKIRFVVMHCKAPADGRRNWGYFLSKESSKTKECYSRVHSYDRALSYSLGPIHQAY